MSILDFIKKEFQADHKLKLLNKFIIFSAILLIYFVFASFHYGIKNGFLIMLLTWSFFVLSTPIPDGGIILDLPMRVLFKIRMIYSEIFVWLFAISLNIVNILFNKTIYSKTLLLKTFKHILIQPIPYWIIIILSCAGTFLSIVFSDEVLDVISDKHRYKFFKHKKKYYIILIVSIVIFIVIVYHVLLTKLGINVV